MQNSRIKTAFAVVIIMVSASIAAYAQVADPASKPRTVLFVHGMFMNAQCWESWTSYFHEKGFNCTAPSWPYHDGRVEELRKMHPQPGLGSLTLDSVVRYFSSILDTMKEPPVLVGHSMGGLVVQILLNRGYGACGIAIDPAPPSGVFTADWSFLKVNLATVNPFAGNRPDSMTFKEFQYAFVNGLPLLEQKQAYETYAVPESRNVARSSLGKDGKIDFRKKHAPLLIIAGKNDHIIPPGLNHKNFERYRTSPSHADFKEFEGRTHFILGQDNWQEVAEFAVKWVETVFPATPIEEKLARPQ
jgi:pimeloyl-ACP methyl ester carboxylesterase